MTFLNEQIANILETIEDIVDCDPDADYCELVLDWLNDQLEILQLVSLADRSLAGCEILLVSGGPRIVLDTRDMVLRGSDASERIEAGNRYVTEFCSTINDLLWNTL